MATFPKTDVERLWVAFKKDPTNQDLRNRLVLLYIPVVRYHASRIWARLPPDIALDDLVSAGTFGLMAAIDAFDLSRSVKFETYAATRIRGAILDELRAMDWAPRLVRQNASKLRAAADALWIKLGREPAEDEMAEAMDMSPTELRAIRREASPTRFSLSATVFDGDCARDIRQIDTLQDRACADPTRRLLKDDLLRLVLRRLNRRERLVIILYYYEDFTMREIAETLNVSESRISQMHHDIKQRLKAELDEASPEFDI